MSSSILDSLLTAFRSQGLGEVAAHLGQPEGAVSRGFETTAATMLGALGSKTADSGFMRQIFDLASGAPQDEGALGNLAGLLGGAGGTSAALASLGSRFLPLLFGTQQTKATELIGQSSGLTTSAVTSLMKVAGPMLLVFLGRRIRQDGLNTTSLASLLGRESTAARAVLPQSLTSMISGRDTLVAPAVMEAIPERSGNRWVLPLLAALVLLGGLWWFMGRNRTHQLAETAQNAAQGVGERARTTAEVVQQTLTSGAQLSYPKGGLEDRLVTYLKVSQGSAATEWFEFDRLMFDTDTAVLQPSSQEQLKNVAEILKAYPKIRVKIGGYTDNTGNPAANQKLSQERAESVMNELVGLGISADRLKAEGYGQDHPVADNSTEDGRQKNRRVALRVTES